MATKKNKTVKRSVVSKPAEENRPKETSTALVIRPPAELPEEIEMSVEQLVAQVEKVHEIQRRVMKEGVHYGVIPGTDKPTLYQPGAQTLCLAFKLDPQFEQTRTEEDGHLTIFSTCVLASMVTGRRLGSGQASCSTKESRFAYRQAARTCPECGKAAIIKGKAEYGGGWLCWAKKDGCGLKFKDGDSAIEKQPVAQVDNEDLALQWNSVVKQANIRSLRSAVLNVTAASDIFTQDMGPDDRPEPREVNQRPSVAKTEQPSRSGDPYSQLDGWSEAINKDIKEGAAQHAQESSDQYTGKRHERTAAHNHLEQVIEDYCKAKNMNSKVEGIEILEKMSAFKGSEGKIVPGVRDILLLSEKRAIITRVEIQKVIDANRNWRTDLGEAIINYCRDKPLKNADVLKELCGKTTIKDMDQKEAQKAYEKFQDKYGKEAA